MTDDVVAELDRWLAEPAFVDMHEWTSMLVQRALDEIVKLQRHYALSLNDYDGGRRIAFESRKAWMDRLRALKDKRHD